MSSQPHSTRRVRSGPFLGPGNSYRIWRHYTDDYRRDHVFAVPVPKNSIAFAIEVNYALATPLNFSSIAPCWFCPVPFDNDSATAISVSGVTTGGRTIALSAGSARRLGIPPTVELDLCRAGWGLGTLQLRPEIKGAGTRLSRTKLGTLSRQELMVLCPSSAHRVWARKFANAADPLFASLFMYEGRPLGAQAFSHGTHALQVSMKLLGNSRIRVAPTVMCAQAPAEYASRLAEISKSAEPRRKAAPLFEGELCTELRMTPGHVRAAYFDTTRDDTALAELCRAVSTDPAVLWDTYYKMIDDSRNYIDTLCFGTRYSLESQSIIWPKFGDVYILFRRDAYGYPTYADEYRFHKRAAWYIAKDEVVVPCVGKVTVDAESVSPNFISANIDEMSWHHELYILNILRDHARVTTGYLHGLEILTHGRSKRTAMRDQKVLSDLVRASQESDCYELAATAGGIVISLVYPLLGHTVQYTFTYRQLLGRSSIS
jgi:hypothetical protein